MLGVAFGVWQGRGRRAAAALGLGQGPLSQAGWRQSRTPSQNTNRNARRRVRATAGAGDMRRKSALIAACALLATLAGVAHGASPARPPSATCLCHQSGRI
eukprot:107658-Chlamydomonas_euryale.AAC.7